MNYDTLAEIALQLYIDGRGAGGERLSTRMPHYGCRIDFRSKLRIVIPTSLRHRSYMLKLHGSISWQHCTVCDHLQLYLPRYAHGIMKHYYGNVFRVEKSGGEQWMPSIPDCTRCRERDQPVHGDEGPSVLPIIVAPTYNKNIRNNHLRRVWHQAEQVLREANHIYFIGYSLPENDVHVAYMLMRSALQAFPSKLKVTVVIKRGNGSPQCGVRPDLKRVDPTYWRYRALFGEGMEWHECGCAGWVRGARGTCAAPSRPQRGPRPASPDDDGPVLVRALRPSVAARAKLKAGNGLRTL